MIARALLLLASVAPAEALVLPRRQPPSPRGFGAAARPRRPSASSRTPWFPLRSAATSADTAASPVPPAGEAADPLTRAAVANLSSVVNGSDVRGTYATEAPPPGSPPTLTPHLAYLLGRSAARALSSRGSGAGGAVRAVIGRDPRPSGQILAQACAAGLAAGGAEASDAGLASTPAVFDFCLGGLADIGIMCTASHLPIEKNGFKMFTASGILSAEELAAVVDGVRVMYEDGSASAADGWEGEPAAPSVGYMEDYIFSLENKIMIEVAKCSGDEECDVNFMAPLEGIKVVVNAGGGSAAFFAEKLKEMGADTRGSIGTVPNQYFPNGIPNPENPEMVKKTLAACEAAGADLGIMFDTDGDRAGFVARAPGGKPGYEALTGNRLIALLAVGLAAESPGCSVVTDSVTSEGLAEFLANIGVRHVRFRRGYAKVINRAKELQEEGVEALMAIETSGHCAMAENGWMDDGTYTAVKIIGRLTAQVAKGEGSVLDTVADLAECEEVTELRLPVRDGQIATAAKVFGEIAADLDAIDVGIQHVFQEHGWEVDEENLEGLRVRVGRDGGFFMIRPSLHDPLLSMQLEGKNMGETVGSVATPLVEIFQRNTFIRENLDFGSLEEYIE